MDALTRQHHPRTQPQLQRALDHVVEAQHGRRLRRARATIGALPALLRRTSGQRQANHHRCDGHAASQEATTTSPGGRGVAIFGAMARRKRRKNHGRARPASELAWREVLGTVPRDRVHLARLQNVWPDVVPRHLQQVAWPARLAKGNLVIHVDDNQWLHELTYLRRDLLGRLRQAAPAAELTELRLRVGEVEVVPPPEPVPEPHIPGLPIEPERETIDAMEAIGDTTLRDAVAAARLALGSR